MVLCEQQGGDTGAGRRNVYTPARHGDIKSRFNPWMFHISRLVNNAILQDYNSVYEHSSRCLNSYFLVDECDGLQSVGAGKLLVVH